jgi:acyl carrier protein
MSDDTKNKIRAVLEEHIGPAATKDIGDQDSLRDVGKTIEWVNVVMALETEFSVPLDEMVVMKCDTIDMIARLIDTIVASDRAPGH